MTRRLKQRKTFGVRTCAFEHCQKTFEATKRHHIYCSDECRTNAYFVRLSQKFTSHTSQVPYATPWSPAHNPIEKEALEAEAQQIVNKKFESGLEKVLDEQGKKHSDSDYDKLDMDFGEDKNSC